MIYILFAVQTVLLIMFYFLFCLVFCRRIKKYVNPGSVQALELKDDERELLAEWTEKGLLKCCSCFSKNVKTEKLKRARERNGLKTNEQLKALYILNCGA